MQRRGGPCKNRIEFFNDFHGFSIVDERMIRLGLKSAWIKRNQECFWDISHVLHLFFRCVHHGEVILPSTLMFCTPQPTPKYFFCSSFLKRCFLLYRTKRRNTREFAGELLSYELRCNTLHQTKSGEKRWGPFYPMVFHTVPQRIHTGSRSAVDIWFQATYRTLPRRKRPVQTPPGTLVNPFPFFNY